MTLKNLIFKEFKNMTSFAKKAGLSQSAVWRDCNGREIADGRFAAYVSALSPHGARELLLSRVRDMVPPELERSVEVRLGRREDADPRDAHLPPETDRALRDLAEAMAEDAELRDWAVKLIRKIC